MAKLLVPFDYMRPPYVVHEGNIYQLSATEYTIFKMLASGLGNVAIAEKLGRDPRTVGHHLRRLRGAMGIPSVKLLVVAACRWAYLLELHSAKKKADKN